MFQTPLRVVSALRPNVSPLVIVATAVSTVVFTATPFLITGLADTYDMRPGRVGIISTAQLAGFVVASWGAGRLLRPRRRIVVWAVLLGAAANIASALVPFGALIGVRIVSGLSLGAIAWIAWAEVFGDDERTGDIAVIGPLVGTVASPLLSSVMDLAGSDWVFIGLGVIHLVPLAFVGTSRLGSPDRIASQRHRPTRAAVAMLVALGLLTFGGSSVFIYAAAIGTDEVGLGVVAVSLVFSANNIVGIPSARWRGERRHAALWTGVTATCAVVVAGVHIGPLFIAALTIWGFAFWMTVPAAFSTLARHSRYPAERAGDAQAYMAAGRVVGPVMGGAMYEVAPIALAIVGGGTMLLAAAVFAVMEQRPGVAAPES